MFDSFKETKIEADKRKVETKYLVIDHIAKPMTRRVLYNCECCGDEFLQKRYSNNLCSECFSKVK